MSLHVSVYGVITTSESSPTLHRLLNRLAGVCGGVATFSVDANGEWKPNFMEHVVAYVPGTCHAMAIDEKVLKVGKDLVQVRLRSSCWRKDEVIQLDDRSWRLATYGHPDPAIKPVVVRSVVDVDFKGDVFEYLKRMGYDLKFAYCRKGYWFNYSGLLTVFVHQLYKMDEPLDLTSVKLVESSRWIVEVTSLPVTQAMVAETQILLSTFSTYLTGLVELKAMDPWILQHRV